MKKTTYEDEEVRIELTIKDSDLTWSSIMSRVFSQFRAQGYVIDYNEHDEQYDQRSNLFELSDEEDEMF